MSLNNSTPKGVPPLGMDRADQKLFLTVNASPILSGRETQQSHHHAEITRTFPRSPTARPSVMVLCSLFCLPVPLCLSLTNVIAQATTAAVTSVSTWVDCGWLKPLSRMNLTRDWSEKR